MQRVKWLIIIIVKMERTITITVPDADEIKMYTNEELGGQLKGMYMNWLKGIKNEGKLNLFGKVAVFKGKEFENTIFNMFKDCFKGYNYKQVSSVNHYGDGILESPSGLKVMVELKNYGSVVPTSQVDKLKSLKLYPNSRLKEWEFAILPLYHLDHLKDDLKIKKS